MKENKYKYLESQGKDLPHLLKQQGNFIQTSINYDEYVKIYETMKTPAQATRRETLLNDIDNIAWAIGNPEVMALVQEYIEAVKKL